MRLASILALCLLTGAAASHGGPALAQTSVFRSATVQTGKVAQIAVVTALKRDCAVGELGGVRVTTPPKHGSLVVKAGRRKTPASFRCPNVDTPIQAIFYQPNPNFAGEDEVSYQAKTADGAVESFTVKITITAKPTGKPATQDL